MTADVAIDIAGLRVDRGGRTVIGDLALAVGRGSVTGLLGPSGCGKSTLMRSIVGVQRVAAGRVTVLGLPAGTATLRGCVGYVTQAPAVYGDLTVEENLRYFAAIAGAPRAQVREAVATVGLAGHERQVVGSLSGGELSRVSLATALVGRPEVLVLDEPTVGLDPVLREDLWRTFRALAAAGTTLLISSHVMDEADQCDELVLMREGAILRQASPAALRAETGQEQLARAFLKLIEERGA